MAEVIQCPQCDKKFRLPDNPPATFTCSQCSTLMDLSDFGGSDAGGEAEPARPARYEDAGSPRSRKQRRGGGGGGGGGGTPSRSRGGPKARGGGGRRRRGGAPQQQEEYDDTPAGRRAAARAAKGEKNGVMIGAIVALVVVVALVAVIIGTQKDDPVSDGTKTAKGAKDGTKAPSGLSGDSAGAGAMGGMVPVPVPGGAVPGGVVPVAGAPAKGDDPAKDADAAKKKKLRSRAIGRTRLQAFDWPEEVDAETRAQVDEALRGLHRGGRDGVDARDYLESKGRIVCGRLISEFKALQDSPGFLDRDAASMAGAIDQVLRSIDGFQERRFKEERVIRATSQPSFIVSIARRWTAWWASDEWKLNPRDPWDPMVDNFDEPDSKKKKKKKGTGYTKRAGG